MPEGPHFHPRVLPSNPDESLTVPERSTSASPQPSTVVHQSTAIMRKDSGAAVSVLSNISNNNNNNNNYEPDDAKVAPRRGRCHRNSSSLSAGNKKVSFSEDHARNNAAIAAATALLNNRNVSNEETASTQSSADRERSPAASEDTCSGASLELAAPLSNARPAVQRAQSQRDARSVVAIGNGGISATNNAATNQFKYKSKRSASFRDGLLRQGESYQVLMLGAPGVGKSSLVRQFQSGGHISVKVSNVYGDNCRRANDAQLTIVDNPAMEITAEMVITCCDADAYVIVYSVTDGESFKTAQKILQALAGQENRNQKAAILVGNKVDLVRRRVVNTEEGKACATSYGSKFIETSDWINYNVDELFAGVLSQIRLRLNAHPPSTASAASSSSSAAANSAPSGVGGSTKSRGNKRERRGYRRSKTLGAKSWGVIKDLINKINRKVKSCDDLHVL